MTLGLKSANRFHRWCFLIVAIALLRTANMSSAAQETTHSAVLHPFRDQIKALLSQGEVTGLSISLVRKGQLAETNCFGWRNAASKTPLTNDTVFEAASLSKPVVAFGVLQLVDRGSIALDDPVSKYIDDRELQGDPRWKVLTVRMLLNHTSGLPNELLSGERLMFSFTPGTRFSYSGIAYSLLQEIVEHISGLSFEHYMESAVFRPLHMVNSSFVWRADYDSRKANGHNSAGAPTPIRKPTVAKAPSSLHTTASDYARFVLAVLNRERLSARYWKAMVTPSIAVQKDCVVCVGKPLSAPSQALYWGLGWGIERVGERTYLFHWGENNGDFQSFVQADINSRDAIVILTNSGNGLSIIPAIVKSTFRTEQQAFTWMGYDTYDSPFFTVLHRIVAAGATSGLQSGQAQQLTENQWNRIGYNLLARSRVADAIAVFEHNVRLHPDSANVYDSLGEAYAAAGRSAEAIENYKKSLLLDPKNDNARQMIENLKAIQRRHSR